MTSCGNKITLPTPTPLGGMQVVLPVPLQLDCGVTLDQVNVAYACYGTLNQHKDNAILVCHALTGDQFMAEKHPITGKDGWWNNIVGVGKPLDTKHYAVFCVNILGGCMGSSGAQSLNPKTDEPFGLDFPVVTIKDMVNAQYALMQMLGIAQWHAVIGGSMGAMQALAWAAYWPKKMKAVMPIAGAIRHSAQNIAFHEVGRQAVMADPDWHQGRYYAYNTRPKRGLAVARMTAHVTYLSEQRLHEKFGRHLQNRDTLAFGFDADFQVESYLRYQGKNFVERFDANSYLYLTRAMDYFDLEADFGSVDQAMRATEAKFCVIAFSSDWLFPPAESRVIVKALSRLGKQVSYSEIESNLGHDAFLLDVPIFADIMRGFISSIVTEASGS